MKAIATGLAYISLGIGMLLEGAGEVYAWARYPKLPSAKHNRQNNSLLRKR